MGMGVGVGVKGKGKGKKSGWLGAKRGNSLGEWKGVPGWSGLREFDRGRSKEGKEGKEGKEARALHHLIVSSFSWSSRTGVRAY